MPAGVGVAVGNGVDVVVGWRVGGSTGVAVAEDLIMGEADGLSGEATLRTGAE